MCFIFILFAEMRGGSGGVPRRSDSPGREAAAGRPGNSKHNIKFGVN